MLWNKTILALVLSSAWLAHADIVATTNQVIEKTQKAEKPLPNFKKITEKAEKTAEKAAKKSAESSAEKSSKKVTEKSVKSTAEKTVEKSVEKPVEKTAKSAKPATEKASNTATEHDSVYRLNFASPSKNIVCGGDVLPAYGGAKGVSCYVVQMDNKPLIAKPKSCDGKWGNVFELGKSSQANLGCYTDTPYSQNPRILSYGKTIRGDGWYCTSLSTGMKCVNDQKHGFEIGRKQQVLF